MEVIKFPQDNVEAYLYNSFNINIYNELSDGFVYKGVFNPLDFFNHLYSELDFFSANILDYLKIKHHFRPYSAFYFIQISGEPRFINVIINNHQRCFFVETFTQLMDTFEGIDNEIVQNSCQYIHQLYELVVHEEIMNAEKQEYKYDFINVAKHLETLTSTTEKIKYLIEIKTDYLQNNPRSDEVLEISFNEKCELEIQKIQEILNLEIKTFKTPSTERTHVNSLNWQGSTLEFSEFSKALIESGLIGKVTNEKEVFEKMKDFFNVEDFDKSDKLKQVRNRTKTLTPVIQVLETALTNWIKRKD